MRTRLLCLLLCLTAASCATRATLCQGALQPINATPQPKATQAPASDPLSRP
jgi:hypothetical protein